jgi:OmpA-OmpF porin, OOP family
MNARNLVLAILVCICLPLIAQQKDDASCKDHPLFTRMPDSWIHHCSEKEFDSYKFMTDQKSFEQVEGHFWTISYYPQASVKTKPSELQILRNYENAVKKLGGKVVYSEKSRETLLLKKDGKEIWIEVSADWTGKYGLKIMEKKAMVQDIVANADAFMDDLRATGHSALYGIHFDTGKSELKPESQPTIEEIAKLLKKDMNLKLYVVGHTDNVGRLEANVKLSQERAEAVIKVLCLDFGINNERLTSFGNGPFAPVASNDTEEGRGKNRRVELVKQ